MDLKTVEGTAVSPGDPEVERQKHKHKKKVSDKIKNLFFMKRQKNSKSCETPSGTIDAMFSLIRVNSSKPTTHGN